MAFNNGELSPRLDARVDLEKASLSAKRMENMVMHQHGGAKRRPGLKLVSNQLSASAVISDLLLDEDGHVLRDESNAALQEE